MADLVLNSFRTGGYLVDALGIPYYPTMRDYYIRYSLVNSDGNLSFGSSYNGGWASQVSANRIPVTIFTPQELSNNAIRMNYRHEDTANPHMRYQVSSSLVISSWNQDNPYRYRNGSTEVDLRSHRAMATAWDPAVNRTIFAWVSSNRSSREIGGNVLVSAGFYNSSWGTLTSPVNFSTLSHTMPTFTGQGVYAHNGRTNVSPAITCGPVEHAGTYNCMLAWTDRGIPRGRVLYAYFRNTTGTPDFYKVGGNVQVWARGTTDTVTSPALGFFNNTFHMAWKRAHTSAFGIQYAWRTAAYATWSSTSTVASNAIDSPTYLFKNGAESSLIWTQIP